MVENQIIIKTTDLVRCAECPLRTYFGWFESMPYEYHEQNTIWANLEHNVRAIFCSKVRKILSNERISPDYSPIKLIDEVLSIVFHDNPTLISFSPKEVDKQVKNLRDRLLIEETNRFSKYNFLINEHTVEETLDLIFLPNFIETGFMDEELGIAGIIDGALKINGDFIPMDIKCYEEIPSDRRYDLQLCIYSMLMKKQLEQVGDYGIIYDAKTMQMRFIPFSEELKQEVKQTRTTFLKIIHGSRPNSNPSEKRCQKCPYRTKCPEKWMVTMSIKEEGPETVDVFSRIMKTEGSLQLFNDKEVA
jgi:CRISPR/Cas system-associated exonuclease Cas4 (RecB family)